MGAARHLPRSPASTLPKNSIRSGFERARLSVAPQKLNKSTAASAAGPTPERDDQLAIELVAYLPDRATQFRSAKHKRRLLHFLNPSPSRAQRDHIPDRLRLESPRWF